MKKLILMLGLSTALFSNGPPSVNLSVGYGHKFDKIWTAAEVFYQFDDLNSNGISSKGAYGAAVHLGFIPLKNFIFYGILGVESRSLTVKEISKNYRSVAFTPGVGARFALSENFSIKTEYKYAMHKAKSFSEAYKDGSSLAIKGKPSVHSFNVGMTYTF